MNGKAVLKTMQRNLFTKQKQSHRCREQTYGYQAEAKQGRNKLGDWD